MSFATSPAASQPLASAKGIAAPLPVLGVPVPPSRTFTVPPRTGASS